MYTYAHTVTWCLLFMHELFSVVRFPFTCSTWFPLFSAPTFTNAKIEIARTVKQDQTTVEGDVACIYSGQSLLTQQSLSRPYNVTYHYFNGTGLIGQDTQGIHGLNTNKLCVINTNMRSITGVVVNSSNDCASSACLRVSITETSLTWRRKL